MGWGWVRQTGWGGGVEGGGQHRGEVGDKGVVVDGGSGAGASGAVGEGGGEEGDEEGDAFEGEGFGEGGAAGGLEEVELFAERGAVEGRGEAVVADSGASGELGGDAEEVAPVLGAKLTGGRFNDGGDDAVKITVPNFTQAGRPSRLHPPDAGAEDGVEEAGAGSEVVGDGGVVALSGEGDDVAGAGGVDAVGGEEAGAGAHEGVAGGACVPGHAVILTGDVNNGTR
jgi:hypothetical protein